MPRNKNQNTFAKRQRENDKRRKAEDKLKRRAERKATSNDSGDLTNAGDANRFPRLSE
jgi:hypothetical protein